MITLFQDKVLIRRLEKEKESILELTGNSYEPFDAEVLETGPGKVFIEMESASMPRVRIKGASKIYVKKGDKVLVKHNIDYPLKVNGEWLAVVKESDILAVYE